MRKLFLLAAVAAVTLLPSPGRAEEAGGKPSFEVYGFAQADLIQDFNRVRPDWNATLRPSRIPTADGLYGSDGETIFSVRQSRLGVKGSFPVAGDVLFTKFEFDFFGTGSGDRPDAGGQNGVRLRHAYGEWGPVLAGITHSLFMDADLWPNIIDYWGPAGMSFYRNVQLRYTLKMGANTLAFALERPATDLDPTGNPGTVGVAKLPDVTAQYRLNGNWGWLQVAGILRYLGYDTPGAAGGDPKGHALGYGADVSSVINAGPMVKVRLSGILGKGLSFYFNDCGAPDLAFGGTLADPKAEAVPTFGLFGYVDVAWNAKMTSSFGYSSASVTNTDLQGPGAFKQGQYASANLLWTPAPAVLFGPELLWGQRKDNDGATGKDVRVQFSMKYSFSSKDVWK